MTTTTKKIPALASAQVKGKARVVLFEQTGVNGLFFGGYLDGKKVTANIHAAGVSKETGAEYKAFLTIADKDHTVATGHAINGIKGVPTPAGNVRRLLVTIEGETKATTLFVTKTLSDEAFAALGFIGSSEVIKKNKTA